VAGGFLSELGCGDFPVDPPVDRSVNLRLSESVVRRTVITPRIRSKDPCVCAVRVCLHSELDPVEDDKCHHQ